MTVQAWTEDTKGRCQKDWGLAAGLGAGTGPMDRMSGSFSRRRLADVDEFKAVPGGVKRLAGISMIVGRVQRASRT